jgi:hypothetical protein
LEQLPTAGRQRDTVRNGQALRVVDEAGVQPDIASLEVELGCGPINPARQRLIPYRDCGM